VGVERAGAFFVVPAVQSVAPAFATSAEVPTVGLSPKLPRGNAFLCSTSWLQCPRGAVAGTGVRKFADLVAETSGLSKPQMVSGAAGHMELLSKLRQGLKRRKFRRRRCPQERPSTGKPKPVELWIVHSLIRFGRKARRSRP
jgi:hypothetical protein